MSTSISISIDGKTVVAILAALCSCFIAFMPADSAAWSAALGMQGILTSYLGVKK
jgi:hypothetical protein